MIFLIVCMTLTLNRRPCARFLFQWELFLLAFVNRPSPRPTSTRTRKKVPRHRTSSSCPLRLLSSTFFCANVSFSFVHTHLMSVDKFLVHVTSYLRLILHVYVSLFSIHFLWHALLRSMFNFLKQFSVLYSDWSISRSRFSAFLLVLR